MARPRKTGLEYFPLDVDFYNDLKVRKLMRNYGGGKAAFVYIAMLCKIYESGYYMVWDEDMSFSLSEITGMKEGVIRECVNYCVNVGLFDKDIYDSYRVLTSSGIQARYFTVVAKRRVHDMSRLPYLLVSATEIGVSATEMQSKNISASETGVSVTETDVHVTVTGISEAETPLNKSKVNNSSLRSELLPSPTTPTRAREDVTACVSTGPPPTGGEKVEVREAVQWLKKQRDWLLEMQRMYGIDATTLGKWLDSFVNECNCRGKQEHESLSDVKQHFNDWLKIKICQRRKNTKKNGMNDTPNEPPDYRKQWIKCLAELCQSVSPEEEKQTFSLMRFESFDPKEGLLIVQVPTNEVYEKLERDYVSQLSKFIAKYFGKARLGYRIIGSG